MSILKKPVITEKMTQKSEKLGQYAFIVDKKANKIEIKQAVEKMYNVNVVRVNTVVNAVKTKSRFTKTGIQEGKKGGQKKAYVTVAKGEIIDFYASI
ncbi:MAG: 50S ribosomal protein L23 [Bacteroidetes bacterium]|nr:50S ribosomal protein L23 [Bacteroidota bacterium]